MALHRSTLEADYTERARRRAYETERRMSEAKASTRYGGGRLAQLQDVERAGMLDTNGLFLGGLDGRLLFYNGDAPMLSYLMTGGGKGRDLILPNCAHVQDRSLVILDTKDGENAWASAEFRSTLGAGCIFLNPFGLHGFPNTRINPLQLLVDIVRRGERLDTEAEGVAQILLPPPVKPGGDAWVRKGALRLITLRLEYLAHFEPDRCTLGELWRFVNSSGEDRDLAFAMMRTCGIESIARKAAGLEDTAKNAPKQVEAYRSDAQDALNMFEPGKTFEQATAAHEFDFAKLKEEPHTVFVMVPAVKLDVAAPWLSLVTNYGIETIARNNGRVRTTFLLDEFPQLQGAPSIRRALQVYRAKGVQLWIFAQGRFSMADKWSENAVKEFEDQAAVMTMKYVREPSLIRDLELWSGSTTMLTPGISHSGGVVESANANLGEARRSVLQNDDIVGRDDLFIRVATMPHIVKAQSIPYHDVAPWNRRIRDVRELHTGMK